MNFESGIKRRRKGFGILEVLISATIIAIAAGSSVFLGRVSMRNSENGQERAQAIYLAQQGIEAARCIRDTYWIDKTNATNFGSLSTLTGDRYLSAGATTLFAFPAYPASPTTLPTVTLNSVDFNRKMNFEPLLSTTAILPNNGTDATKVYPEKNAIKVTATVTWTGARGVSESVTASEVMTNWRPNF